MLSSGVSLIGILTNPKDMLPFHVLLATIPALRIELNAFKNIEE